MESQFSFSLVRHFHFGLDVRHGMPVWAKKSLLKLEELLLQKFTYDIRSIVTEKFGKSHSSFWFILPMISVPLLKRLPSPWLSWPILHPTSDFKQWKTMCSHVFDIDECDYSLYKKCVVSAYLTKYNVLSFYNKLSGGNFVLEHTRGHIL